MTGKWSLLLQMKISEVDTVDQPYHCITSSHCVWKLYHNIANTPFCGQSSGINSIKLLTTEVCLQVAVVQYSAAQQLRLQYLLMYNVYA